MSVVHKGDIGTIFEITVTENDAVLDISTGSNLKLLFLKPSGTVLTKTGSFTTDGSDGKMEYQSQSGDIDEEGTWELQGKLDLGGGTFYTIAVAFPVKGVLA
jgi:hypothetical protein